MHLTEPLANLHTVPLQQRKQYQTDLDRLAAENAALRETRRKLSEHERMMTDETTGFNKPGGGAPLRSQQNEKITKTGLVCSLIVVDTINLVTWTIAVAQPAGSVQAEHIAD